MPDQDTVADTQRKTTASNMTSHEVLPPSLPLQALGSLENQEGLCLTRQEINRMILEYLVVEGYKDVAEKFSRETGINEPFAQMKISGESLADRMTIREAVLKRDIEEVIKMVNRLWPELFDNNPVIYFKLRQIQMIELIRHRRLEEALVFAQTYLCDPIDKRLDEYPQLLGEMQNTMALLAFENPTECIYGKLLGSQNVELVAGSLNRAILSHIESISEEDPDSFTSTTECNPIRPSDSTTVNSSNRASTTSSGKNNFPPSASSVPRLTKMMAMLLHFRDIAHIDLPPELSSSL